MTVTVSTHNINSVDELIAALQASKLTKCNIASYSIVRTATSETEFTDSIDFTLAKVLSDVRHAAAKKAWETIRAKKAALIAAAPAPVAPVEVPVVELPKAPVNIDPLITASKNAMKNRGNRAA